MAVMLFAIGDIHGHFDKLMALMDHCRRLAERDKEDASFVLLGDYVDRGPASNAVLAFLAGKPAGVRAIRGNHEALMLDALTSAGARSLWLANGGLATLASYGALAAHELPADHIDVIQNLPVFIDDGVRIFVHAGIDPSDPDGRRPEILMWTRKHPPDEAMLPRFVVHGHTPTSDGMPDLRPNRLNLDTGAGFGRMLTAAAFDLSRPFPRQFVNDVGEIIPAAPPTLAGL